MLSILLSGCYQIGYVGGKVTDRYLLLGLNNETIKTINIESTNLNYSDKYQIAEYHFEK